MKVYQHKVQYYETDQMGFVHHSNYIRWFEEARDDFFNQTDAPYKVTESKGILSPVISVNCKYIKSCYYGELINIYVTLVKYGNVKFTVGYKVVGAENGELKAEGETEHCFLSTEGKVVSMKRVWPEMHEKLSLLQGISTGE